ncbi:hypothetical protein [Brevibacillus borstelensis]|uniref:hypothetical protein n=1 Tax=Brevibacillus borstelensis TaxID=45462 RepID=UPI00287F4961|nr:hypothetical protein [Brevibacillus borstelensis]WNF07439.1 hypothetical protein RFB14_08540 [Brevibacillus borstelensis]
MSYDTIRNRTEEVSQFRSTYLRITSASPSAYERFLHEVCEGTTFDYDEYGGRHRRSHGQVRTKAVRLA